VDLSTLIVAVFCLTDSWLKGQKPLRRLTAKLSSSCSRLGRQELRRTRAGPAVGCRHNLRPLKEGLCVSCLHPRCLQLEEVVGWSMATHHKTELVVDALQMAIAKRKPSPGLVHHSDRGVQYTSLSFGNHLENEGLLPSMGRVGSACDNALAESFVATLKTELLYGNRASPPVRWRGPLSSSTSRASIITGGGTPL
jgi:Integrase core domain